MSFQVTNLSGGDVNAGGLHLAKGQSKTVEIVTQAMEDAKAAGAISISPLFPALVELTDNSGGTAADTIAAIGATYDQDEVANAVASLAAKINILTRRVASAEAQAREAAGIKVDDY